MLSPFLPALAGSDPLENPVKAQISQRAAWIASLPVVDPESIRAADQMQGSGTVYRAPGSVGGTVGAGRPIGASTGLELPKHRPKGAQAPEPEVDLPEGPNVQPMRDGLPDTPIDACRELILAIVARGMMDQDLKYITSAVFIHHLLYMGMDPDAALNVKIAYLSGKVKPGALEYLDRPRRAPKGPVWP